MTQHNKDIQKDKDLLLEKLLDPDATLTDVELDMLLADKELREIHEISAAVRGTSLQPSEIDVEQEWKLFRHKLHPRSTPWRWIMRVAAIFLGILFVSGILKFGIDRILTDNQGVVVAESQPSAVEESKVGENPKKGEPLPELIPVVEEATDIPVRTVRRKRPVRVEVEEEEEVDIDEYLRLQQARIDNEVALLQAQLYIEELQALDVTLPFEGEDAEPQPQEVRYIIMQ